jgi:hypothetical protein
MRVVKGCVGVSLRIAASQTQLEDGLDNGGIIAIELEEHKTGAYVWIDIGSGQPVFEVGGLMLKNAQSRVSISFGAQCERVWTAGFEHA